MFMKYSNKDFLDSLIGERDELWAGIRMGTNPDGFHYPELMESILEIYPQLVDSGEYNPDYLWGDYYRRFNLPYLLEDMLRINKDIRNLRAEVEKEDRFPSYE